MLVEKQIPRDPSKKRVLLKIQNDDGSRCEVETEVVSSAQVNPHHNLRIHAADAQSRKLLVYMRFGRFVTVFHFCRRSNSVPFHFVFSGPKYLKSVWYLERKDVFVLNDQALVYIFDNTLRVRIHRFEVDPGTEINFVSRNQKFLVLSDGHVYWEVSLLNFRRRKRIDCLDQDAGQAWHVLDKEVFPLNQRVKRFCRQGAGVESRILVLDGFDSMNLDRFPFHALRGCFKKNNFRAHVAEYSRYYFSAVGVSDNYDDTYGPLNPQLMLVYHNDHASLEADLARHGYSSNHARFVSPLEFCFKLNHYNCARTICNYLAEHPRQISLSRRDFRSLLDSNFVYSHRLLARVMRQHANCPIANMVYMRGQFRVHTHRDYLRVAKEVLLRDARTRHAVLRSDAETETDVLGYSTRPVQRVRKHKTEVDVFCPEVPLDFGLGSGDSVEFLENYSETPSAEFLTSEWRFLVLQKWARLRPLYLGLFLVYAAFMALFTLGTAIYPELEWLRLLALAPAGLLFLFEVVEMVSFLAFRPSKYFRDVLNFVDALILAGSGVFLGLFAWADRQARWFRVFAVVILFFVYFRGFSYLKFFDTFTTLVSMVNIILVRVIPFMAIVAYFYGASVLLMVALSDRSAIVAHLRDVYYWVLFGGIQDTSFEIELSFVVIVTGTLLVTVVLLNILIAYLSNLFSSLENRQALDDLREKARFVLGVEVIVRFFRYKLTGQVAAMHKAETHNSNLMVSGDSDCQSRFLVIDRAC